MVKYIWSSVDAISIALSCHMLDGVVVCSGERIDCLVEHGYLGLQGLSGVLARRRNRCILPWCSGRFLFIFGFHAATS